MPPRRKKQKVENKDCVIKVNDKIETNDVANKLLCTTTTLNTNQNSSVASQFLTIEKKQCVELLNDIDYGQDICYIYNPIEHAAELHEDFVNKYCKGNQPVLLMGMNPGPWGMCQTGVPFGQVQHVIDFLKIKGNITQPSNLHPKRPIEGLQCKRNEVSGDRMWSLLKDLSEDSTDVLFKNVFIHNYCPLAFMKSSAKNVTPADMKVKERVALEKICDIALINIIRLLGVKYLIGIGAYASKQAQKAFKAAGIEDVQVSTLMHPSPISPAANKGWHDIAKKQLTENNMIHYFQP